MLGAVGLNPAFAVLAKFHCLVKTRCVSTSVVPELEYDKIRQLGVSAHVA